MTDRARELVEGLGKLIAKQRDQRGDYLTLGQADPELVEARDFIEQSLTPPEGDTLSGEVVERANRVTVALTEELIMKLDVDEDDPQLEAWGDKADELIAAALQSRVSPQEGLREALERIANWRKESSAYTDSMNLPRRKMDEAQVIHIEHEAERALREFAALSASRMSEDAK